MENLMGYQIVLVFFVIVGIIFLYTNWEIKKENTKFFKRVSSINRFGIFTMSSFAILMVLADLFNYLPLMGYVAKYLRAIVIIVGVILIVDLVAVAAILWKRLWLKMKDKYYEKLNKK